VKQLEIQIMGHGYLLGCPEGGESRLLEAVERVDTAMCRIRDAGKVKARDRIAVLAALNLASELADHNLADWQARLAPSAPAAQAPTPPAPAGTDADDPRLSALLARLDSVLGSDGQLL
jgi:cell division protein ZapA